MKKIVRLGTRGSPLALIQAEIVRDTLYARHKNLHAECDIEIVPIRTSGDWKPSHGEQSFAVLGATKGLFTKEIEESLLDDTIDCAVHSMKDVSVFDHEDLCFTALLEREDPRDALLSPLAPCLEDLPKGARVGTSSLRRKAQVLAYRPDLKVMPLRGNVDTRLKKLANEDVDATILAVAGLKRLDRLERIASIIDMDVMLPAACQGMLGIQIRADDDDMKELFKPLNHDETVAAATAERAVLRALDGSCRTPIGSYASVTGQHIEIKALAAKEDGSKIIKKEAKGPLSEADKIGYALGLEIKAEMPEDFFCC